MTTSSPSDYAIGSREQKHASLASSMRRHADSVNVLADDVAAWATEGHSPRAALALIERAQHLVSDAEGFYRSDLIGPNTKASFRNEASIALGATNGHSARGRGDLSYALMYALAEIEKYGAGTALTNMATKASSLRVHAASCRVIAGILDGVARGEIGRVG